MQKKTRRRTLKLIRHDNKFRAGKSCLLCGVDEAGRGPLAGPVLAAAVVVEKGVYIDGVFDSKQLSSAEREKLFDEIMGNAICCGIGLCDSTEIDSLNIYQATILAMSRAVTQMTVNPDIIIADGNFYRDRRSKVINIIRGDEKSFSIAAASIIAKVTRDRMMEVFERIYPAYSFSVHKGYATRKHINEIKSFGYSDIHRRSFKLKCMELMREAV
jgi:ribonuclease HII